MELQEIGAESSKSVVTLLTGARGFCVNFYVNSSDFKSKVCRFSCLTGSFISEMQWQSPEIFCLARRGAVVFTLCERPWGLLLALLSRRARARQLSGFAVQV